MEPRKVIKFGNSSYVVTLPFEFVKKHKLNQESYINMTENKNSILLSLNKEEEVKTVEISFDGKPMKLVNKELISKYIKNYKTITLKGKGIIEKLEQIKVLKEKLSSVEIVEIEENKIVLKDLSSPGDLNVASILQELVDMEKNLFRSLRQEDKKSAYYLITSLDKNINKLAFLAYKAINYNQSSWTDAEHVKDSIFNWRIISALEAIGDIIKRLARYLKDQTPLDAAKICTVLDSILHYFEFVTDLLNPEVKLEENLKLQLDKKTSLLREIEELRDGLVKDDQLALVLTQLFKDIVGNLDNVVLSIIDLND